MEDELQARFGRPVDRVEIRSVQNPIRRKHILENRKLPYAASEDAIGQVNLTRLPQSVVYMDRPRQR